MITLSKEMLEMFGIYTNVHTLLITPEIGEKLFKRIYKIEDGKIALLSGLFMSKTPIKIKKRDDVLILFTENEIIISLQKWMHRAIRNEMLKYHDTETCNEIRDWVKEWITTL